MKIIITADIHNGVPGKTKDTAWSMEIIRKYASDHKIYHVLVLGDLFHDRLSINIEVLNRTYAELKLARQDDQEWISFPGNHDMFLKNSWMMNSLRPLESVLTVYEDNTFEIDGQRFFILPFIHYESEYMEQLDTISQIATEKDILLTHIGVHGATLNECFLLKNWNYVTFDKTPFYRIYTGHFHCQQKVGNNVWYPGSPIPFRFDEGLVDHGFFVYDLEARTHEMIKIYDICTKYSDYRPPDYVTIVDNDIPDAKHMISGNNVKIILSKDYTLNERIKLKEAIEKRGAQKVNFSILKTKIKEADSINSIDSLGTSEDLFKSWLDHDKPKHDIALLTKLHESISKEAEERITIRDPIDA